MTSNDKAMKLTPRYIINDEGERVDVILSIASYEFLLENLADLAAVAERRSEPTVKHSNFIAELKADGLLSN